MLAVAPMRIEALAARVPKLGRRPPDEPFVLVGTCGAVDPSLRAGDVVVATELRHRGSTLPVDAAIADSLRPLKPRTGPIVTVDRIAGPGERAELGDALAVDLESFWVEPQAVVRVVVDEAGRRLLHPRTVVAGVRALRTLRRVGKLLASQA
jgi:4-hydroxy-3-methylbut-2-en-1-yl diphosphate reductase